NNLPLTVLGVVDVLSLRINSRKRRQGAHQDPHRMRVIAESVDEELGGLVQHGVVSDLVRPLLVLLERWQLTIQQQISDLQIRAMLRERLDIIASVTKDALVAVNEGDVALA